MNQTAFTDFQELLLYALGPFYAWGLVFLAAGGIFAGIAAIWLDLLKFLTRR